MACVATFAGLEVRPKPNPIESIEWVHQSD